MTIRIADERWTKKAANWNPGFSAQHQSNGSVGIQKKWDGEINDFIKLVEIEETKGSEIKNNDTWIKVAKKSKDGKQWKPNSQLQQQAFTDPMQDDPCDQCHQSDT